MRNKEQKLKIILRIQILLDLEHVELKFEITFNNFKNYK